MAELTQQERLQPSLLDRLTDKDPAKTQESRNDRILSIRELRAIVLRDLAWLFSCTNLASSVDLEAFPEVERSVLNYGLPDLSGQSVDSLKAGMLERMLDQAIRNFEPRILPKTLKVRLLPADPDRGGNSLAFEIDGDMWAQPLPQHLYLETKLDLEVSQAEISERGQSGSI
ncbi:MAG: type VI secretion system baseplate subunit TssE [Proteobacteria bacterium]|nr:type VI secretion system baseplate subunit TssE [Pseudomonadota bacterium]